VFSIKLYDQDNATGNLLGQTAVSKTIVANTANTVSATVNGVLGKITLGPATNQPFVESNGSGGFVLVGQQTENFIATPEDPDGNAIVAPGIVPKISLTSSSPAIQVSPNGTNEFFVNAAAPTSASIALIASVVGTGVSATFTVAESAAVYVTNVATSAIDVFDQNGNPVLNSFSGLFPRLSEPVDISYDGYNGHLYVTNFSNNTITVYDQSGNLITTSGSFPNLNNPNGIAFDSNPFARQFYIVNTHNNTITVYDENGNQISTSGSFPSLNRPGGIAFARTTQLLYVGNTGNNVITVYDPSGDLISLSPGGFPNLSAPNYLAFGSGDADLYVPNDGNNTMTVYDHNGNQIPDPGAFTSLDSPDAVALNPLNGDLYVTNRNLCVVEVYDQTGHVVGVSGPFGFFCAQGGLAIVP
jgi:6-phosphogluconolactonase (cycloisomerase 2 family)